MKTLLLTIALIFAPVLSFAQSAQCGPYESVREQLLERYGESRVGQGLGNDHLFEVYSNDSTGSWTIVITDPNNVSCLAASGEDWESVDEQAPPNL